MKTIEIEESEIQLLIAVLDEQANAIFQMRIAESKKGKQKDERYAKQLLDEYNKIEAILKKLKAE